MSATAPTPTLDPQQSTPKDSTEGERKEQVFPLMGMTCLSCAASAEKAIRDLPGVEEADVNFSGQRIRIAWRPGQVDFDQMKSALARLGYKLVPNRAQADAAGRLFRFLLWTKVGLAALGATAILLVQHVLTPLLELPPSWSAWFAWGVTIGVLVYSAGHFYRSAFQQALQGQLSMDTLVSLGTAAAFILQSLKLLAPELLGDLAHIHSESAVFILLFILGGQLIEEYARAGANQQLDALGELLPERVTLLRGGRWAEAPLGDLQPGDRIRISSGGRIPADSLLASPSTETNESLLTGEPLPLLRRRNDRLLAGSVNVGPTVEAEVLNKPGDTLLDQIITQVEQAQATKAPAQRLADRISAVFVPVLLGLSALTFLAWVFIVPGGTLAMGLTFALTVLIISCPCALGLATPVAVKVGVTRAARHGLLVREAAVLEQAAQVGAVFFDKTGTLTVGQPAVTQLQTAPPDPAETADANDLRAVLAVARGSNHPIAQSLAEKLPELLDNPQPEELPEVQLVEPVPGQGMRGWIGGTVVRIGKPEWLAQALGDELPSGWKQYMAQWSGQAKSLTAAAVDKRWVLLAALEDRVDPQAASTLEKLQEQGLELRLLSGDTPQAAEQLKVALPTLTEVTGGMLPADKAEVVQQAQRNQQRVAFVGDGINDAIALRSADIGIAMSSGAQLAMSSAPVTLLRGRFQALPRFFRLARQTRRIIWQNIGWAFGFNLVALPLAMGFFYPQLMIDPIWAALAMACSSLAVVLNSLRIR